MNSTVKYVTNPNLCITRVFNDVSFIADFGINGYIRNGVMVNFTCQFQQVTGCLESCLSIILGIFVRMFHDDVNNYTARRKKKQFATPQLRKFNTIKTQKGLDKGAPLCKFSDTSLVFVVLQILLALPAVGLELSS